jgi:hypothetical protein
MSAPHEIAINVISAASLSPEDESDIRTALASCSGPQVLKALSDAWKAEENSGRMALQMPEGKGQVTDNLKFKELEFFKDLLGEAIDMDDDRKLVVRLQDDQLTQNRVTELYAVLAYLGSLVGGWEADSEFSWTQPGVGTSAFYWEGDGQTFPESDFN